MPSVSPGSIARFDPLWGSLALVQRSRILAGVAGVVVVFGRVNPDSEAAICRLIGMPNAPSGYLTITLLGSI